MFRNILFFFTFFFVVLNSYALWCINLKKLWFKISEILIWNTRYTNRSDHWLPINLHLSKLSFLIHVQVSILKWSEPEADNVFQLLILPKSRLPMWNNILIGVKELHDTAAHIRGWWRIVSDSCQLHVSTNWTSRCTVWLEKPQMLYLTHLTLLLWMLMYSYSFFTELRENRGAWINLMSVYLFYLSVYLLKKH